MITRIIGKLATVLTTAATIIVATTLPAAAVDYPIPPPGNTSGTIWASTGTCSQLSVSAWVCQASIHTKALLNGWNPNHQRDNKLFASAAMTDPDDGNRYALTASCQGATAGLTSCERNLLSITVHWTSNSRYSNGPRVCADFNGWAWYYQNSLGGVLKVFSSDFECVTATSFPPS